MKRKQVGVFWDLVLTAIMLSACSTEPVPMQVEVSGSEYVASGCAESLVKIDTANMVIARNAVANENTDTVYDVQTTLALVLINTFNADKMEEPLQLQFDNGLTLVPVDGNIADSLIAFLKKAQGETMELTFAGQATKSQFLQLANAKKVSLTGFSFHEFDPEAMADPKISRLLDSYEGWLKRMKEDMDADMGRLPQMYVHQGLPEAYDLYKKLAAQEISMSPKQKERFASLLRLHKNIDFPEK